MEYWDEKFGGDTECTWVACSHQISATPLLVLLVSGLLTVFE